EPVGQRLEQDPGVVVEVALELGDLLVAAHSGGHREQAYVVPEPCVLRGDVVRQRPGRYAGPVRALLPAVVEPPVPARPRLASVGWTWRSSRLEVAGKSPTAPLALSHRSSISWSSIRCASS